MDFYFDTLGFEEKIKKTLKDFCEKNSLILYATDNLYFLDDAKQKPNYLKGAHASFNKTSLIQGLSSNDSPWKNLRVLVVHRLNLIDSLYDNMGGNDRYIEALNKYITKTFEPSDVARYLKEKRPYHLEDFLTTKKPASVKSWATTEVFKYVEEIFKTKTNYQKSEVLHAVLKNNKLLIKDLSFKKELSNLVSIHIPKENQNQLIPYYQEFEKALVERNSLFNTPQNVLILEINKAALHNKINFSSTSKKLNDKLYDNMLKNLNIICNAKKFGKKLNISNLNITQKQQTYSQIRLTFDSSSTTPIEKEKIENFLELFFESYSNSFGNIHPNKDDLLKMVEKLIFSFDLENMLEKKNAPVIQKKKI